VCGIVGVIDHRKRVSREVLNAMRDCLAHRGPDDQGSYINSRCSVGLGHRRLSILDLSPSGHQPMSTPDGRLTIVFNGEIYNYLELRDELRAQGQRFTTGTDTEVLLRGYEAWGVKALDRLAGMFAFAIWDDRDESLLLARDRVGKKPLVYFQDGNTLAFASELKALLLFPSCRAQLDPAGVEAYLAFGYIPAPLTVFKNIRKLEPGHYLRVLRDRAEVVRYWFPERANQPAARSRGERIEQLRALFRESVKIRLRSDVPLAIFLSGGIDSAAVAAECCAQGQKLRALTSTFDHDHTDLPYGTKVAQHLGLEQEVIHTNGDGIGDDIYRIVWHYDEPFADSSNIPSYYISQAVKGRFKVVLNGDGGDEAFGGYPRYEHVAVRQFVKGLATMIGARDGRGRGPWQRYFQSRSTFVRSKRTALLGGWAPRNCAVTRLIAENPFLSAYRPSDAIHMALGGDRHIYLAHDLLFKMDIALMAHHTEGRSPFLDHRLLEWAQNLPADDLVVGREKKVLLREALRGRLPSEVLARAKHGFAAPMVPWLQGPLRPLCDEHLPTHLLEREPQESALAAFRRTQGREGADQVWALLMFAIWANQWRANW